MVFPVIALVLLIAAIALAVLWQRERRQTVSLTRLNGVLAGHIDSPAIPFELLQQAGGGNWVELATGGDNHAGTFANKNSCPCRLTYTCATKTIALNAWPNPNPNPVLAFPWNAPHRQREPWPCPGKCVIVPIQIWRGWVVARGPQGQILMHIHTFTQYHCKEPDDPDINKPPEGWELPPKPGDIEL